METDVLVARLRAAGCVFAEEEALILVAAAGTPADLDVLVERRAAGEPLEQVVGWAEFCGLRIIVDPEVFVPRRRSEFLVSVAVGLVRPRGGSGAGSPVIADVCCGTGALGLAVADKTAFSELHAADLDPAAVRCARRNVEPVGGRVYQGDLLDALPASLRGRIGVLICNAPYVPTSEIVFMPAEARDHEAPIALDGGADGLDLVRRVVDEARALLTGGGILAVEVGSGQAEEARACFARCGYVEIETARDYAKIERVVSGEHRKTRR